MTALVHPCPSGTPTDGFGPRGYVQGLGDLGTHTGQDFSAPAGTPILAAAGGVVIRKWWDKFVATGAAAGGWMIAIRHDDGTTETRYAHMLEESPLAVGTRVAAGQQIGKVGSTGAATGNHLHFEVLIGGKFVDPLNYIGATGFTTSNQSLTQEDDDDMLTMYENKADGMVLACSLATGYSWHIPNMDYLNLMKARGLVKNQDPIKLESNEFGFLQQLLSWASDSLNRAGNTAIASVDQAAIKSTVTEALGALNVNVDALATAIAAKINAGVTVDDVTTKADILAAIETNYPEGK